MSIRAALERAGVAAAIAQAEAPRAEAAMLKAGITTQRRASMFLAQVLHESAGLRYFEEIASGAAYEGRADLGNTHPGDGVRYKGRGPIQLTGRTNYRAAGAALGLPLERTPELASKHAIGWLIATWFWQTRGLNALADRGDFTGVTRRINGGVNGLASRRSYLARVSGIDCRPRPAGPAAWLTANELRLVREFDGLVRTGDAGSRRAAALRGEMTRQRKRIWRAAQGTGGWTRAHRRERYGSLRARTT